MTNSVSRIHPQAATSKHINDLSDLVLKHIFDRLPLVDLVHRAGRVCRTWTKVLQVSCHNRHTLTLIIANDNKARYTKYCSAVKKFLIKSTLYHDFTHQKGETTQKQASVLKGLFYSLLYINPEACLESVERVAQFFPSITHLQVSAYVDADLGLAFFSALLKHYGNQLVSLKLHSHLIVRTEALALGDELFSYNRVLIKMQPILDTIGAQLPKLAYLTLTIDGCFDNLISVAAALPVFLRLHKLCIYTENFAVFLKPFLLHFDSLQENLRCQPVKIHRHSGGFPIDGLPRVDSKMDIQEGNSTIDHILSNISWAQFYYRLPPLSILNKLPGLKGLYFSAGRRNVMISQELFNQLARLDSLVYLYLHVFVASNVFASDSPWTPPAIPPHVLLSPLRSIRWLKLKWEHKHSHADFLLALQLPRTFPQLHTLILRCSWQDCFDCYPRPILLKGFKNYPEGCWRRLEAEVSEICAQMPWLARLDYKCAGEKAEFEFNDIEPALAVESESDPESFLYGRLQFSRAPPSGQ